jgi:hypothetical protein
MWKKMSVKLTKLFQIGMTIINYAFNKYLCMFLRMYPALCYFVNKYLCLLRMYPALCYVVNKYLCLLRMYPALCYFVNKYLCF